VPDGTGYGTVNLPVAPRLLFYPELNSWVFPSVLQRHRTVRVLRHTGGGSGRAGPLLLFMVVTPVGAVGTIICLFRRGLGPKT